MTSARHVSRRWQKIGANIYYAALQDASGTEEVFACCRFVLDGDSLLLGATLLQAGEGGSASSRIVLDYLLTTEERQGLGYGSMLLSFVRAASVLRSCGNRS